MSKVIFESPLIILEIVSDGNLITSYDFEFEDSRTILNKFLLVASKHEFESQCSSILHYGISSENPIELNIRLFEWRFVRWII
mgnify:CR=1 FL=1